jgi:hypothetical protein
VPGTAIGGRGAVPGTALGGRGGGARHRAVRRVGGARHRIGWARCGARHRKRRGEVPRTARGAVEVPGAALGQGALEVPGTDWGHGGGARHRTGRGGGTRHRTGRGAREGAQGNQAVPGTRVIGSRGGRCARGKGRGRGAAPDNGRLHRTTCTAGLEHRRDGHRRDRAAVAARLPEGACPRSASAQPWPGLSVEGAPRGGALVAWRSTWNAEGRARGAIRWGGGRR